MKSHILLTYSGQQFYIDAEQASGAHQRINDKEVIIFSQYPGHYIMPGDVKTISPTRSKDSEPSSQLCLEGGFEKAAEMLDNNRGKSKPGIEKQKQEIRAKLEALEETPSVRLRREMEPVLSDYRKDPDKWRKEHGYDQVKTREYERA